MIQFALCLLCHEVTVLHSSQKNYLLLSRAGSIAKSGNSLFLLFTVTNTVTFGIHTEESEMFSKEFVQRRFPFTKWLPQYNFSTLVQDMLAGLTVALTLVPQSIAYAEIAGLQPQVYMPLLCNFRIAFQEYICLDQE
jgi:hypothetical protein